MGEKLVTVFTPTYNRSLYLPKLFESLKNQTNKDFKWLIIDDGSTDDTREIVSGFDSKGEFEIEYIKKENGGKHTALNLAFEMIESEFTFVVDSDDVLTKDAIKLIYDNAEAVRKNNLAGMIFLKGFDDKTVIGDAFPADGIFNDIDIRFRKKVHGDKAEIYRTDILKNFSFPVFKNEKFQGENYVWWQIAFKYDMLYVNKIVYLSEYLPGGLSKSGRALRISCPLGGMENSKMGFSKKFPLLQRIKCAWLFVCYGFFAKKGICEIVKASKAPWLVAPALPFGWLLYIYWSRKHK